MQPNHFPSININKPSHSHIFLSFSSPKATTQISRLRKPPHKPSTTTTTTWFQSNSATLQLTQHAHLNPPPTRSRHLPSHCWSTRLRPLPERMSRRCHVLLHSWRCHMGRYLGSYGPCHHRWLQHCVWHLLGYLCCFAFGTNSMNGITPP